MQESTKKGSSGKQLNLESAIITVSPQAHAAAEADENTGAMRLVLMQLVSQLLASKLL